MRLLLGVSWIIDTINGLIGRAASWLILVAVLVSSINAIVRKVFNESSNGWLELQWYLFGAVFMLCAAWTLQRREHIRIDIVSNRLPRGLRHIIELLGHLFFLMPFCLLTAWLAWPFFGSSVVGTEHWIKLHGFHEQWPAVWASVSDGTMIYLRRLPEIWNNLLAHRPLLAGLPDNPGRAFGWDYSASAGGLPIWPAKALILGGAVLLALQGISEICKHLCVMAGIIPPPDDHGAHGQELHEG